jgi:hypothetical protein
MEGGKLRKDCKERQGGRWRGRRRKGRRVEWEKGKEGSEGTELEREKMEEKGKTEKEKGKEDGGAR